MCVDASIAAKLYAMREIILQPKRDPSTPQYVIDAVGDEVCGNCGTGSSACSPNAMPRLPTLRRRSPVVRLVPAMACIDDLKGPMKRRRRLTAEEQAEATRLDATQRHVVQCAKR